MPPARPSTRIALTDGHLAERLARRERQQDLLARFGITTLKSADIDALLQQASAPMFLISANMKATVPHRKAICRVGVSSFAATGRTSASITPERAMPALTIRAEAMMTTMSSAKPESASFAGTSPF